MLGMEYYYDPDYIVDFINNVDDTIHRKLISVVSNPGMHIEISDNKPVQVTHCGYFFYEEEVL